MNPCISLIASIGLFAAASVRADVDPELAKQLGQTYETWRTAMARSDARAWQAVTASHRQAEVRNRLLSEKRAFPASVFQIPVPPPSIAETKCIDTSRNGATAKATYYGTLSFGGEVAPSKNLLVLSFTAEGGRWKYDRADFVNLAAMPEIRREIESGDLGYLRDTPDFRATGQVPKTPPAVPAAKYIAKVYTFCPGREVVVQVNGVSRHTFANAQEAEVIVGGARDGRNDIVFTSKKLPGGAGNEAFTVRVYLMSEKPGTKPIKAYEYLVEEGGSVEAFGRGSFTVDAETAAKLLPN